MRVRFPSEAQSRYREIAYQIFDTLMQFAGSAAGFSEVTWHDKALQRVLVELLSDHTELFKQFQDNPTFKKWLADTICAATYTQPTTTQQPYH